MKIKINELIPWFIFFFLVLTAFNSMGYISKELSLLLKNISKILMISALAAIGLNTSFKDMQNAGIAPMLHGFIISTLVVIVAIAVEYFMGIV